MPRMQPGNRLYLYQLLHEQLGVGQQVPLARVDEALASVDLAPQDMEYSDARSLCKELSDFVRITAFKGGHVFATILAHDEFDQALATLNKAENASSSGAGSGKPWRKKKGSKLKPVRPRTKRVKPVQGVAEEQVASAESEVVPEVETTAVADVEVQTDAVVEPEPLTVNGVVVPESVGADDTPVEEAPTSDAAKKPEAPAAPESEVPAISLTITYVPEDDDAYENGAEPEVAPLPPQPRTTSTTPSKPLPTVPRDPYRELRCSDDYLSVLYQVLPADVDPFAVLAEDLLAALAAGTAEGTRSELMFPLRYLCADGAKPVMVRIRRTARAQGGKPWSVAEVDAGAPEDVDFDGLAEAPLGSWACLAAVDATVDRALDPAIALTHTLSVDNWDALLASLARLAAPEPWGEKFELLRSTLQLTWTRTLASCSLAECSKEEALLATGLVSAEGIPVVVHLRAQQSTSTSARTWQVAGALLLTSEHAALTLFSPAACRPNELLIDPALPCPDLPCAAALTANPRLAAAAWDPVTQDVLILVPERTQKPRCAIALKRQEASYTEIARPALDEVRAHARCLDGEVPSWLALPTTRVSR